MEIETGYTLIKTEKEFQMLQKKVNILVTAAGSNIAQGIIKCIKLSDLFKNHIFKIVTVDMQTFATGLYCGNVAYKVPSASDPIFIDSIIDICNKENIHGILIGTDHELLTFALNKNRIENETNAKVIVSDIETINICNDKWQTFKWLEKNGFPFIPSAEIYDAKTFAKTNGFPIVVKPKIGSGSNRMSIIHNWSDLSKVCINQNNELMLQKYIPNSEFTSTVFVIDGKCVGCLILEREMKYNGITTKAIVKNDVCFPLIIEMAEKLRPLGSCNFQFKVYDNVPFVFEINCRFSGSTPICALMGFNTVEATIRQFILGIPIQIFDYNNGVVLRYFNELLISPECINDFNKNGICYPVSYNNKVF